MNRQKTIADLANLGMVEMKSTGSWGLSTSGREFLDQLAMMRELDDRPRSANFGSLADRSAADRASSPPAAGSTRPAAPSGGAPTDRAAGGMNPAARGANRESTR